MGREAPHYFAPDLRKLPENVQQQQRNGAAKQLHLAAAAARFPVQPNRNPKDSGPDLGLQMPGSAGHFEPQIRPELKMQIAEQFAF